MKQVMKKYETALKNIIYLQRLSHDSVANTSSLDKKIKFSGLENSLRNVHDSILSMIFDIEDLSKES